MRTPKQIYQTLRDIITQPNGEITRLPCQCGQSTVRFITIRHTWKAVIVQPIDKSDCCSTGVGLDG